MTPRCDGSVALAELPRGRVALSIVAGCARGRLRRRADDDRRLSHLARGRAAADPLPDDDRSSPSASSRSRGRSRATSSGSSRTTSRSVRSGGSVRRFYERIEPLAPAELDAFRRGDLVSRHGRRRRRAAGPLPPWARTAARRARRRRRRAWSPSALVLPARRSRARARAARSAGVAVPLLAARLGRSSGTTAGSAPR